MPSETPDATTSDAPQDWDTLARDIPDSLLQFLVRAAPSRETWKWLQDDEQIGLLHGITRGFQRTPNVLRQPAVRTRLVSALHQDGESFRQLLHLWSDTPPLPHAVEEVRDLLTQHLADSELHLALNHLSAHDGAGAIVLALLREDQATILDTWEPPSDEEAQQLLDEEAAGAPEAAEPDALTETAPDESRALEAAQAVADALRSELQVWKTRAQAAEASLAKAREDAVRQARESDKALQVERKRLEAEQGEHQELKRLHDRSARKLRHEEKLREEEEHEIKRLKRQLRQGQQVSEELRRELAQTKTRLEEAQRTLDEATRPKKSREWNKPQLQEHGPDGKPRARDWQKPQLSQKLAEPQVSPLDQTVIWKSDGRTFRVSPRDIKRAVDRNDEGFVHNLIQAFDALKATNPPGHDLLWQRVRELGRYYERVMSGATTRVLIDASNVARHEKDARNKGRLQNLLAMRDELRRRDCFPILLYADASLPYNIDNQAELIAMERRGELIMTTPGQEADELLAREARRTGAYVVTNDRNFHLKVSPDFEPPRITFRIHDGYLIVDDF